MPTPNTSYSGYVYLIGSKRFGWYKIGCSLDPKIRVSDIGILLPFRIERWAIWKTGHRLDTITSNPEVCLSDCVQGSQKIKLGFQNRGLGV